MWHKTYQNALHTTHGLNIFVFIDSIPFAWSSHYCLETNKMIQDFINNQRFLKAVRSIKWHVQFLLFSPKKNNYLTCKQTATYINKLKFTMKTIWFVVTDLTNTIPSMFEFKTFTKVTKSRSKSCNMFSRLSNRVRTMFDTMLS